MKIYNYLIQIFDQNGVIIDNYYYPFQPFNRIYYDLLSVEKSIDDSFNSDKLDEYKYKKMYKLFYKHKKENLYTSFSYLDEVKYFLKNIGFNIDEYYIFDKEKKEYIRKDVIFYGGRGGEYYVLNEEEEFEFITSKGFFITYYDNNIFPITIVKNHGEWKIKGMYIYSSPATIHGDWKISYNQEILITKKLNDNDYQKIKNIYEIIYNENILIDKYNENVIKLTSDNDYNYKFINFRRVPITKISYNNKKEKYYIKIYVNEDKYIWVGLKTNNKSYYDILNEISNLKIQNRNILIKYKNEDDFKNKKVKIYFI